jgi:ubiquinone/menaquinone biosynthesis C-methylase UbiE
MQLAQKWLSRLLGIFFTLLYNSFAASYDLVAWIVSLGRWKSWVLTSLPELAGPRVLELGHGPGHLQVALNEKVFQTIGIDLSRQMGKLAKRRLSKFGFPSSLVRAEAQNLPFARKSFDQVVATFPTEYISSEESLEEIHRVAAEAGEFVIIPVAWITGKPCQKD